MLHPMKIINEWWKSLSKKQQQKIRNRELVEYFGVDVIKDPRGWFNRLLHIHRNSLYIKYHSIYYKKKGGKINDSKSIPREHSDDSVPA